MINGKAKRRGLPVLCYHEVGPRVSGGCPGISVSPEAFRLQMEWLAANGYHGVDSRSYLDLLRSNTEAADRAVLITFDDAYAGLPQHAFPVLREFSFTAVVFVVTGQIGGCNEWDVHAGWSRMPLMTLEEIQFWSNQGIEFGSHTVTHPHLTSLTAEAKRRELRESAGHLERILPYRPRAIAFPYGDCDPDVIRVAAGEYEMAFTTVEGLNGGGASPMSLQRSIVQPTDSMWDFRLRMHLGWSPIHRLREKAAIGTKLRRLAAAVGV